MRNLNKNHFAAFSDWCGTVHIQFRIREKFLDCIKVNGRGLSIVTIKRRKAEKRGIRYVPKKDLESIVGKVATASTVMRVPTEMRELIGQIYEGVTETTPEGEGTMPGCPARTPADDKSASITQAGVAST